MNILIIPSWYPTADHPITGIFIKEQVDALSRHFPKCNFGISLWGSHDHSLWLDKKSFYKLGQKVKGLNKKPSKNQVRTNLVEYFTPAFTWTRKLKQGNIEGIIQSNSENLRSFEAAFGKTDLIHAHVCHPAGVIAKAISDKTHIPYIITEHMGPFPFPSLSDNAGIPIPPITDALSGARQVASVSKFLSDSILSKTGVPSTVIPNLVDEHTFITNQKKVQKTVIYVGRMVKEKGIEEMISAWLKLSDQHPDWDLHLIGDGPLLRSIEHHSIIWKGQLSKTEISSSLQTSAFLILPTHYDNNPLVIIEAMACGVPVLATAVGGIPEMIHPEIGRLIPPNNEVQLVESIQLMIKEYTSYDQSAIREHFLRNYSSGQITKRIMSLYNETVRL